MTTIDEKIIARFREHKLTDLIARNCGVFPWELGAAIVEIESEGQPGAYNYYSDGKLYRGVWTPGTPLPDGEGGRTNAWAVGLLQIIRKYPRGLSLAERFDPEKNAAAIFPELKLFYAKSRLAGLDGADLDAATYLGHNQGPGALGRGLQHTHEGGIEAVVYGACSEDVAPNVLAVCRRVASHAAMWRSIRTEMFADLVCSPEVMP